MCNALDLKAQYPVGWPDTLWDGLWRLLVVSVVEGEVL